MQLNKPVLAPFDNDIDFSDTFSTLISRSQIDDSSTRTLNDQKRIDKRKIKLLPPDTSIGLMDLRSVLAHIPISRSGWLEGVRTGRYPAPVRLSARRVAWRFSDIKSFIDSL